MNELYREIEEDMRRERLSQWWRGFGKIMVSVSVAVILGTIGIVVMQHMRHSRNVERTDLFMKGLEQMRAEDFTAAAAAFSELAQDEDSSYYGMAMLRTSQAQDAMGDHDDAIKTREALARRDDVFGALARLASPQAAPPAKDSPLYHTRREAYGWQLMQEGRKDEALAQFLALYEDPLMPSSQRERLQEALAHLAREKLKNLKAQADNE